MEEWVDDLRSVVVARSLTADVSLSVYSKMIAAIYLLNNSEHTHRESRATEKNNNRPPKARRDGEWR
jgi:hypothetical protein